MSRWFEFDEISGIGYYCSFGDHDCAAGDSDHYVNISVVVTVIMVVVIATPAVVTSGDDNQNSDDHDQCVGDGDCGGKDYNHSG